MRWYTTPSLLLLIGIRRLWSKWTDNLPLYSKVVKLCSWMTDQPPRLPPPARLTRGSAPPSHFTFLRQKLSERCEISVLSNAVKVLSSYSVRSVHLPLNVLRWKEGEEKMTKLKYKKLSAILISCL